MNVGKETPPTGSSLEALEAKQDTLRLIVAHLASYKNLSIAMKRLLAEPEKIIGQRLPENVRAILSDKTISRASALRNELRRVDELLGRPVQKQRKRPGRSIVKMAEQESISEQRSADPEKRQAEKAAAKEARVTARELRPTIDAWIQLLDAEERLELILSEKRSSANLAEIIPPIKIKIADLRRRLGLDRLRD